MHFRIGILGGTFDPIHCAHILVAHTALTKFSLDRIFIVPAGEPYHREQEVTGIEHRLAMVAIAIEGDDRLELSLVDVDRSGPTYSIDTVKDLKDEFARTNPEDTSEWFFIIGADTYQTLSKWREPNELLAQAHLIVVARPETDHVEDPRFPCDYVEVEGWDVSSTQIRQSLKSGISLDGVLPAGVEEYIRDNNLYGLTVNDNQEGT